MNKIFPPIMQNPHEDSKLLSNRNYTEQDYQEIGQRISSEQIPYPQNQQNTLSQQQFSDPSRSLSLIEQLKKQLSNPKHYNLPRQIKSLFGESQDYMVKKNPLSDRVLQISKKELEQSVKSGIQGSYDLPRPAKFMSVLTTEQQVQQNHVPKKSLKQSIYERLMNEKREKQEKLMRKKSKEQTKEATFRPYVQQRQKAETEKSKNLKEIIKNKMISNLVNLQKLSKLKNISLKKQCFAEPKDKHFSTEETKSTKREATKYESLLRNKQNLNMLNKPAHVKKQLFREDSQEKSIKKLQRAESYVGSMRLRERSIKEGIVIKNDIEQKMIQFYTRTKVDNVKISQLGFHDRQTKLLDSKTQKILKYEEQKRMSEMNQCTFKPRFTPYQKQRVMSESKSYAELHKNKITNRRML